MRGRGVGFAAGGVLLAWALVLPPAQASPEDPAPRSPLSDVLAVDPSTVSPPDDVAARAAIAGCPSAAPVIHNSAPGSGRTVALTFDDGPGPETAAMIRVLEDAGVAGTFFNIGANMTVRPELVQVEHSQGFTLG